MMKRIAICISGLVRYWDVTYPLFEHWNKMFDDVEFYFFLSTWKGTDSWYDKSRFKKDWVEYDYDKCDFLTDYSLHDEEEVFIPKGLLVPNAFLRAYSIKQTQQLRRKYEQENNFKFDGVVQTRNDIFIGKGILSYLIKVLDLKEFTEDNMLITPGGCGVFLIEGVGPVLFQGNDNFIYSNSKTMDKLSYMYDWLRDGKLKHKSCHKSLGEFIYKNDIQNLNMMGGFPLLVRGKGVEKSGLPTPEILRRVIDTKGVDWIYKQKSADTPDGWVYG